MSSSEHFKIAIVGGGLCGLALAIALKERSIPFTLYESRSSFMEIGAGINLGPNTLQAFRLIDESLGEAVPRLFTSNPPPKEHLWMTVRLGAPTELYEDGSMVTEISAPPTGNATVRRNDLLQLLAERVGSENAVFDKKVVEITQNDDCATLKFSDGTESTASAVIACDGIHSTARRIILGEEHPAATSHFSEVGAYRAVLPFATLAEAVGTEIASTSTIWIGPGAYVIQYPVELGQKVNVGLWPRRAGPWPEREWVLPSQGKQMEADFEAWGEPVHKIMALMPNPPFSAAFHHVVQPESVVSGRVCLIGDAAHAMGPHQGAGAGQAMEDAYVVAEVIAAIAASGEPANGKAVQAALKAYENVRMPRAQRTLETSAEAYDYWTGFYRRSLTEEDLQVFARESQERFKWIWNGDLEGQALRARALVKELLSQ